MIWPHTPTGSLRVTTKIFPSKIKLIPVNTIIIRTEQEI